MKNKETTKDDKIFFWSMVSVAIVVFILIVFGIYWLVMTWLWNQAMS